MVKTTAVVFLPMYAFKQQFSYLLVIFFHLPEFIDLCGFPLDNSRFIFYFLVFLNSAMEIFIIRIVLSILFYNPLNFIILDIQRFINH